MKNHFLPLDDFSLFGLKVDKPLGQRLQKRRLKNNKNKKTKWANEKLPTYKTSYKIIWNIPNAKIPKVLTISSIPREGIRTF
jgi:hypothetical protein